MKLALKREESIMRRGLKGSLRLRGFGIFLVAGALAAVSQLASADASYAEAWGPSVGTKAPLLAASIIPGPPPVMIP